MTARLDRKPAASSSLARFNRLAAYPLSALAFFGVGFLCALAV